MKKINQFKTFLIISAVVAILVIITVTMTAHTNNAVIRTMNDGVSVVQNGFISIINDVRNFGQRTFGFFETYDENELLRRQMYSVELVNIENELLKEELEILRQMLDIDNTLIDFERISAVTIGRDINNWHDYIMLNKGSRHGIERGQAVVSSEGYLIGRITEVNLLSSRVGLMKTRNNDIRADVEVSGLSGTRGTLHGFNTDTGELVVTQLPIDIEIEEGKSVITRGLSGVFPRGLLAGTVIRSEISSDGLTQTLFLENNVNYDDLRFVFVIKRGLENPMYNPLNFTENELDEEDNESSESNNENGENE